MTKKIAIILLNVICLTLAQKCPKFVCGKEGSIVNCAESTYNVTANFSTVVLNPGSCGHFDTCYGYTDYEKGEQLNFYRRTMEIFLRPKNEKLSCVPHKDDRTKLNSTYPGENCFTDSQCYSSGKLTSKCVNKVCSGKAAGESCEANAQCVVGTYCNSTNFCVAQKNAGSSCSADNECQNDSRCYKKNCTKLFSLKVGTKVEDPTEMNQVYDVLCENGILVNNVCAKSTLPANTNRSPFLECEFGKTCNYNLVDDKGAILSNYTLPCDCGFNKDGKSYCPASMNDSNI
jgi:hypothetical protein